MKSQYQIVMESLKRKIELLISRYEQAAADNRELNRELSSYKEQLEIEKNRIKELEEKIDRLQLADAFTSSGDNREAKQKVNSIIREIDKCIALLND